MSALSRTGLLRLMRAADAARAQADAIQLRAMARFAELADHARGVSAEIALSLSTTERRAQQNVTMALALTARLPSTLAAMESGAIDAYKASKIVDATSPLSDEHARVVDAAMATRLGGKNPSGIRRAAARLVVTVDPEGHADRAAARRRDRCLRLVHHDDAMGSLIADLPVEAATAVYSRVDRIAHTLRGHDESRTLEQLRADVLTELCLGQRQADMRAEIVVHVRDTTIAAADDRPAELSGHGPIPAWLARHLARQPGSILRKVVTDPVSGTVRDVGRTRYRPPAALADAIRIRDRECRMPGCHRPTRHCDIDHATSWAKGGATAARNLIALCRKHHRLKDQPGWHFALNTAGDLTITTPSNARHTSTVASLGDKPLTDLAPF